MSSGVLLFLIYFTLEINIPKEGLSCCLHAEYVKESSRIVGSSPLTYMNIAPFSFWHLVIGWECLKPPGFFPSVQDLLFIWIKFSKMQSYVLGLVSLYRLFLEENSALSFWNRAGPYGPFPPHYTMCSACLLVCGNASQRTSLNWEMRTWGNKRKQ